MCPSSSCQVSGIARKASSPAFPPASGFPISTIRDPSRPDGRTHVFAGSSLRQIDFLFDAEDNRVRTYMSGSLHGFGDYVVKMIPTPPMRLGRFATFRQWPQV